MDKLRTIAYDWHGGSGSPLYSFASTGGTVHSEEHREALQKEVLECRCYAGHDGRADDKATLTALLAHVDKAKVGEPLE